MPTEAVMPLDTSPDSEDDALISRFLAGEQAAFETLFRKYQRFCAILREGRSLLCVSPVTCQQGKPTVVAQRSREYLYSGRLLCTLRFRFHQDCVLFKNSAAHRDDSNGC